MRSGSPAPAYPRDARKAWRAAYGAIWLATLGATLLTHMAGGQVRADLRGQLELTLRAQDTPPPSFGHVLSLVAHNLPVAAWPVLLGVVGAHRHGATRRAADTLVLVCVGRSVLLVGVALGAYGTALLPFLPQLPLEWAGLALGASAWMVQRRTSMSVAQGARLTTVIAVVLLAAASAETYMVPHRTTPASAASRSPRPISRGLTRTTVRLSANCENWDYPPIEHSSMGHG